MTVDRETVPPALESHLPGPAALPRDFANTIPTDPLTALADRVGALSDELNDPDGLIHRLFASLEEKGSRRERRAQRRHMQVMRALTHLSNGVVELSAQVARLAPRVEEHEARLRLVPLGAKSAE